MAYFFRLEKWAADRWISALREDDGSVISNPDQLCRSFSGFYSSLFTWCPTDPVARDLLLDNLSSVLPSDQPKVCDGPLSLGECYSALCGMAKRKAPGLDGLPLEFYVKFWSVLGLILFLF